MPLFPPKVTIMGRNQRGNQILSDVSRRSLERAVADCGDEIISTTTARGAHKFTNKLKSGGQVVVALASVDGQLMLTSTFKGPAAKQIAQRYTLHCYSPSIRILN